MICTKLHRKTKLELKAVSNIFWMILDLDSGTSVLPFIQSKELHGHSLIRTTLYIPDRIVNIRKAVYSSDGLYFWEKVLILTKLVET